MPSPTTEAPLRPTDEHGQRKFGDSVELPPDGAAEPFTSLPGLLSNSPPARPSSNATLPAKPVDHASGDVVDSTQRTTPAGTTSSSPVKNDHLVPTVGPGALVGLRARSSTHSGALPSPSKAKADYPGSCSVAVSPPSIGLAGKLSSATARLGGEGGSAGITGDAAAAAASFLDDPAHPSFFDGINGTCNLPQLNVVVSSMSRRSSVQRGSNGNLPSAVLAHTPQQQVSSPPVAMPELSLSSLQHQHASSSVQMDGGRARQQPESDALTQQTPLLTPSTGKTEEPPTEEAAEATSGRPNIDEHAGDVRPTARARSISDGGGQTLSKNRDTADSGRHSNLDRTQQPEGGMPARLAIAKERRMTNPSPKLPVRTFCIAGAAIPSPPPPPPPQSSPAPAQPTPDVPTLTDGAAVPDAAPSTAERKEAKRARREAREAKRAAKEARRLEKQQRKLQAKEQRKQHEAAAAPLEVLGAAVPTLSPVLGDPTTDDTQPAVAADAAARVALLAQPPPPPPLLVMASPMPMMDGVAGGAVVATLPATALTGATVAEGSSGDDSLRTERRSQHPLLFGAGGSTDEFAPGALAFHSSSGSGDRQTAPSHTAERAPTLSPLTTVGENASFAEDKGFSERHVQRQGFTEVGVRSFVQSRNASFAGRVSTDNEDSDTAISRPVSGMRGMRLTSGAAGRSGGLGSGSRERGGAAVTRLRTQYSSEGGTATQQARERQDEEVHYPPMARRRLKRKPRSRRRRTSGEEKGPRRGHEGDGGRRRRRKHRSHHRRSPQRSPALPPEEQQRQAERQPVVGLSSTQAGAGDSQEDGDRGEGAGKATDPPLAYDLILTGANGEPIRGYSNTARPVGHAGGAVDARGVVASRLVGGARAAEQLSSAVRPRRCTSAGDGAEGPRLNAQSMPNRPVSLGNAMYGVAEPRPPTGPHAGKQQSQFVRQQHAFFPTSPSPHHASDADVAVDGDAQSHRFANGGEEEEIASRESTSMESEKQQRQQRAEGHNDTTAVGASPQPKRPSSVAGSAAVAAAELHRRRQRGGRGRRRDLESASEASATSSESVLSASRGGSGEEAEVAQAPAVKQPHPPPPRGGRGGPRRPSRGPRSGQGGRGARAGARGSRPTDVRRSAHGAALASRAASSSASSSSSSSSSAALSSPRSRDSHRRAGPQGGQPVRGARPTPDVRPPKQTWPRDRDAAVGDERMSSSRSRESYSAATSSSSRSLASSLSSSSSSYDSATSSGSYSSSSSDGAVRVAAKIPLKTGMATPPSARAFADVAYRLANPGILQPYAERAVIHEWNLKEGRWGRLETFVVLSPDPFSQGNMRASYHMIDLKRLDCKLITKRYLKASVDDDQYFDDVSMHSIAGHWARLYNSMNPPKKVKFVPAAVLELPERQPPLVLAMEPELEGTFRKYNNNCGYVPRNARWTPQAFSHFTFHASHHTLLIVDIQGVGDIYTDPQILSPDGEGYGRGNLGRKGIRRFLKTHRCNGVCKAMGLPDVDSLASRGGSSGSPNARFLSPELEAIREERLPPKVNTRSTRSAHRGTPNGLSLMPATNAAAYAPPTATAGMHFSPPPPPCHGGTAVGNGLSLIPGQGQPALLSPPPSAGVRNPKFMQHIRHQLSRQQSSYFGHGGANGGMGSAPGGYSPYSGHTASHQTSTDSGASNPPSRGPATPKSSATPLLCPPSTGLIGPANLGTVNGNGSTSGGGPGFAALWGPGQATLAAPPPQPFSSSQPSQQQQPGGSTPRPLLLPLTSMEVRPPALRQGPCFKPQ